ncbi:cupredoxin family copper-binding protein [Devosia sp. ZB163]|uniref:cupredoxin domain-containing protein n=1 Tax=Devosia sp. ZB163 TaxID=3025938 RepID=UPI00235F5163|nr:cupredoxin family copper-binding protein [Devosia sp. ZB163]MDC9825601.1 cupredoxin family copper-binding protein [Devosia sp. ZB163]
MRILAVLAATALMAVPAFAADHTVTIKDMKFAPAALTIAAGDTVTFVNQDSAPHTATAQGAFDTGPMNPGQGVKLTFSAPGDFAYICAIHPSMKGNIKVQ